MKTLNTFLVTLLCLTISTYAMAQDMDVDVDVKSKSKSKYASSGYTMTQDDHELEIPLSRPGDRGVLNVESHNGRVTIKAYNGPTVKVKMTKYSKKVKNSEKDGMRLVSSGGFNVSAEEKDNYVKVENDGWNNRVDFVIEVPKNFDIKAETYNNGHIVIEGVSGEVNAESYNGPITLASIAGSASASTYNGAVKVSFTSVTADAPMGFSTYNGAIDLTLPNNAKASAKMKTNKDIYTDFDNFDLREFSPNTEQGKEGKGYRVKYENWVLGKINGGGPEIMMKTTNGNIYIRKGN